MIELPDDELDKLFRKSSEELDPDYEPKDWNALSKRLDREDGKTPAAWFRKWWPIGILALLIPAGVGSYYWMNDAGSSKVKTIQNLNLNRDSSISVAPHVPADTKSENESDQKDSLAQQSTIADSEKPENKVAESRNTEKSIEAERLKSSEKITGKAGINKMENSKILPRSRFKAGGVYLNPDWSKGKEGNGAFSSSKKKFKNNKKVKVENTVTKGLKDGEIAGKKDSGYDIGSAVQIGQNDKISINSYNTSQPALQTDASSINEKNRIAEESRMLISAGVLNHLPFNQIESLKFPAIELSKTIQTAELSEQKKPQEPYPKMAVRFGYSPDLSTVGLKNFSKPGSAFSLMIEYALIRKLYLQAGVVRSEKVYNAKASEYELYPYITKINTPDNIDGTCNMFEIPLEFRYDFAQNARSRWFAGTGFTSYYFNKEKYVYNYKIYVHGQKPGWEGNTGWYWLSHLNVSAGYERRISKKLSLLAEPYVKIPLKKVGYGKIDLLTVGMWLSIRYTPVFK